MCVFTKHFSLPLLLKNAASLETSQLPPVPYSKDPCHDSNCFLEGYPVQHLFLEMRLREIGDLPFSNQLVKPVSG